MHTNDAPRFSSKKNQFGEHYIYELTQDTFSKIDSHSVYASRFGLGFLKDDSFYVICGCDSALLIDFILRTDIPESAKIVIVELPEVIRWINTNRPDIELPVNVALLPLEKVDQQFKAFGLQSYAIADKLYFIQSISAHFCYYPHYQAVSERLLQQIKTIHWNVRIDLDRKDFIVGQLENVAENRIHSSILDNTFPGHTAVLLAGGPSLDELIPWIKKHRDEFVLFAVSRIARRLLDADIQPDFFITVHTQSIGFDVSKEMLHFHKKSILISHAQASPLLVGQWRGKHVYMGHLLPWDSELNIAGQDQVGPTVAHSAFYRIVKMGFSNIILGGVDLCFSSEQKSHASGTQEYEMTTQAEGGDLRVLTNSGDLAETNYAFHRGIVEFSRMVLLSNKRGCRVFNTSMKSAVINGVEVVSTHDLPRSEPADILSQIQTKLELSQDLLHDHYMKVEKELAHSHDILKDIRTIALQGFNECVSALNNSEQSSSHTTIYQAMTALGSEQFSQIFSTLTSHGIKFFASLLKPGQQQTDIYQDLSLSKLYFTAVIFTADQLTKIIHQSLKRLHIRKEELSPESSIDQMSYQWFDDRQPGRALIFQDNHPDLRCETLPIYNELQAAYLQQFDDTVSTSTVLRDKVTWGHDRLDKLRIRIHAYFSQKEREALLSLATQLGTFGDEALLPYCLLAKGMAAELGEDPQGAMLMYNDIIETKDIHQNVLEDSLGRIASISLSLNDLENAELALQCLSDLSLAYTPKYAEFLYISGNIDQALDVYADYLGKRPDDITTMLRLGNIYKDLGSFDGVKMVSDFVLEKDPHNPTALMLKKHLKNMK